MMKELRITKSDRNVIIENLEHFNIEHTMECGQCFHFIKIDEMEYGIVSGEHFAHVKQEGDTLIFYDKDINEVQDYWIHYFDLNRDYGEIKAKLLEKDDALKDIIEEMYGIRILNQEFEETLISFIISQNKQIPHIKQIVAMLSEQYGNPALNIGDVDMHTFPKGDGLYGITEEQFRNCKTGFRAKYLKDAVTRMGDGRLSENVFKSLNYEEAKEILIQTKGVGEKVANCVLLFGLGYREAFPVDVWMKRIMEDIYFKKETSKEDIMEFARDRYGEYGGYAQQYLFHYGRKHNVGVTNKSKKTNK